MRIARMTPYNLHRSLRRIQIILWVYLVGILLFPAYIALVLLGDWIGIL